MVSSQSFGSGAVTLPCITCMCSVQCFFWSPLSLFSLWIILLPPSLPIIIFPLIKLISVKGAWFHWHGDSWLEDAGLPAMEG